MTLRELFWGGRGSQVRQKFIARGGWSEHRRVLLIRENQVSQVKEFSAFLCMGRWNSLGLLKSFLSCASQLSGASILWFDSHVRVPCSPWGVAAAGGGSPGADGSPLAGLALPGIRIHMWRVGIPDGCDSLAYWYSRKYPILYLVGICFFIINSLGKKLCLLQNWLLVMSCKFLGLLSDLGKALSSFFQHMSYKVSGHFKCFCAVSHLNMKDAHSTHFWGPSWALDGTCVSEGCWGLSFNSSW